MKKSSLLRSSLYAPAALGILAGSSSFVAQAAPQAAPLSTQQVQNASKVQNASRVVKKTLPNGLTVLVQENKSAPVVAVRIYVKTGSIYEDKLMGSGISHLFEHTIFEGTSTRTKQQINDDVEAIGGQQNAYTSNDVTAYHITTAAPYFAKALSSIADMMQRATFPEAELKTQQGVIHNEMNMGEDEPDRTLYLLFNRTAFLVHPVRFPVIGYRQSFDRITREDIVNYYKTHYAPENSVLSIAGDVDAQQALALAEKEFGNWARQNSSRPALPEEPFQNAPRRAVVEKDIAQTYFMMGWHTVPLQSPDLYALDTLSQILGGGESSRLVRRIREEKNLATGIGSYSHTPNYNAGVFAVTAQMPPQNAAKVENEIWNEIARIQKEGVTSEELARAKRQIETAFVFRNDSVEEQAESNAQDEISTGDPEYSKRYVAGINGVTAAQVKAIANKYLRRSGTTVAMVVPRRKTPTSATSVSTQATQPKAQMFTLSNGVRLLVKENRSAPSVAISVSSLGGVRLEKQPGVSYTMAEMLTRGTARRNAAQIAQMVDSLGGQMNAFSGFQTWGINSQWLARDWKRGLALVTESFLTPTFPENELARVKAQMASSLQSQLQEPMSAAALLARKTFYGAHPLANPSLGTLDSQKKLSSATLRNFWQSVLQPGQTVVAVYGDVNAAQVRAAAEYSLGQFQSARPPLKAVPVAPLKKYSEVTRELPGVAQQVMWFTFPSFHGKSADDAVVDVLDAALSGSNLPGGRLHARLRDDQLVYVVHAYNQSGMDFGGFNIYAATTPQNAAKARAIIEEEVSKVREEPISPEELQRAKSMAIAAFAIESQSNTQQAQRDALDELVGQGFRFSENYPQRIEAVTLQQVQAAARQYLRRDASALAIIEPKK